MEDTGKSLGDILASALHKKSETVENKVLTMLADMLKDARTVATVKSVGAGDADNSISTYYLRAIMGVMLEEVSNAYERGRSEAAGDVPHFVSLARAGRRIEAIKLVRELAGRRYTCYDNQVTPISLGHAKAIVDSIV